MIIALVIATSACIGLSIRQSAETAREDTLSGMEITANISVDRSQMMKNAGSDSNDSDDGDSTPSKDDMKETLQNMQELSIDEMETYAKCSSVKDFYYTQSASLNASDDLEAVDTSSNTDSDTTTDSSDSSTNSNAPDMPDGNNGGFGGDKGGQGGPTMDKGMGTQGDFTLMGYSSENAMTSFVEGTSKITDGAMFDIDSEDNNCLVSEELATLNSLKVGDTITLCNPNDEDETIEYIISGIYTDTDGSQDSTMTGFSASQDSANRIYTSYKSLSAVIETSEKNATTSTDSDSGMEMTSAIRGQVNGTYVFASVEDYEKFEDEARDAGLSDDYTITSNDLTQYESSLTPLENLSSFAGWFLVIVLIIGAIILVVFNIFNIRNRKYEIGVLTAIGMKKWKVAFQFMTETFVVTFVAIILGAIIGAATSVPVTNALLENQISSTESQSQQVEENFGRGGMDDNAQKSDDNKATDMKADKGGFMGNMMDKATNYVDSVSSATDLMVILELILMGLALTIVSSMASVVFVMRYEPLKILTQRD
jgi:putative ABC transport system permease protein